MDIQTKQITNTHFEYAKSYLTNKWSVIPVWGASQPKQFKVATIPWRAFQSQRPTPDMIYQWFQVEGYRGIAIVTGPVSHLAVLDFDSIELFEQFCNAHPELATTYRVRSRRGWHLYYEISEDLRTRSRKKEGLDWLYNGRYVVAPPTEIEGVTYQAENQLNPRLLSQQDLTVIHNLFESNTGAFESFPASKISLSEKELIAIYHRAAWMGNRNNALFRAACEARDYGWTGEHVLKVLAIQHSQNKSQHESEHVRYREAQHTIQSAFSRPPRPRTEGTRALPNIIKETLCQSGYTSALRVIEALRLLGYQDGEWLCRSTLIDVLQGIVGEWSIVKSLTAILDNEQPLFHTFKGHIPPNPREPKGSAIVSSKDNTQNAFEISYSKPHFSHRGRKTHFYQLPSNAELAERLAVPLSRIADELSLDELQTAKETRKALHRRYIERRPDQYPSKWLSKRLGVSIVTKNRYDNEMADLQKKAEYSRKVISWHNLDEIPEFEVGGIFLEADFKRYPAKQGIAVRLLKQKKQVILYKQEPNSYWIGNRFAQPIEQMLQVHQAELASTTEDEQWRKSVSTYWEQLFAQEAHLEAQNQPKRAIPGHSIVSKSSSTAPVKNDSHRHFAENSSQKMTHNPRHKFEDGYLELFAQGLQQSLNNISPDKRQHLSLVNARRLVATYGLKSCKKFLNMLQQRPSESISNPVGLLIVMLRAEAKRQELLALSQIS